MIAKSRCFQARNGTSVKNAGVCLADHSNQTSSGIDLFTQSIVNN